MRLTTLAPGKLNLCLYVGEPREDGYHPLVSVFQSVSLADEVALDAVPGAAGDEVVCAGVDGPNLAARALAAFREATGWDAPPVRVTIHKRIPVAAGMGGGSADAAATLRLVARAAGMDGDPVLAAIAPRLGADVPSQLTPGCALVTGIGERVEPLPAMPPAGLLVVPSSEELSTPAVYAEADRLRLGRSPAELADAEAQVRDLLASGGLPPAVNDLEAAARSLCPGVDAALDDLRRTGAAVALVSGSGPTVFGVFPGEDGPERAFAAARTLAERHPGAVAVEPASAELGAVRAP